MKRVLLFVLLSGVALAAAGQTSPSQSVEVRGSQIRTPLPASSVLPHALEDYTGAYHLSNGERMIIRKAGQRMFAEIGYRPRKELVVVGANEFMALDRQVSMTFLEDRDGAMTGDLSMLMKVPRTLGDAGGFDVVRLVAGR